MFIHRCLPRHQLVQIFVLPAGNIITPHVKSPFISSLLSFFEDNYVFSTQKINWFTIKIALKNNKNKLGLNPILILLLIFSHLIILLSVR